MFKKLVCGVVLFSSTHACTAFQLRAEDNSSIYCRSMEFGFPMDSDVLIVPRKTKFTGTAPQGKPGLQWSSVYGYVGMNQKIDRTLVCDGMNEKGLVVGCLYFPGYAQYEAPEEQKNAKTMGPWELASYLLGTCGTIEEVKNAVKNILVVQEAVPNMGDFVLPLHFYIGDAKGEVLIIEYIGGVRHEYADPIGILTNSPPLDWHLANLNNFVNLSPVTVPQLQLGDFNLRNYGQGTGLLGLPGDYTPPSRFVRAAFFSKWAMPQKTAADAVRLGFHILNTFDIFEGIVRAQEKQKSPFAAAYETTQWAVVHDKSSLKTYFRTYNSLKIQMVDMKKIDFSKPGLRKIGMSDQFGIEDVTEAVQPLL